MQDVIEQLSRVRVKLALVQLQNLCSDYNRGRKDKEDFLDGVTRNIFVVNSVIFH